MNGKDIVEMDFEKRLKYIRYIASNRDNMFLIDMNKIPCDIIWVGSLDEDMIKALNINLYKEL